MHSHVHIQYSMCQLLLCKCESWLFQTSVKHAQLPPHLSKQEAKGCCKQRQRLSVPRGVTLPITSLRLSLSLSMTVMMMVVSLSTWAGTSKGKDSLKMGFRQRFIVTVFFFSTRLSLCISHTFTYGSATWTQSEVVYMRDEMQTHIRVRFAITLLIVKVTEGSREADT